MSKRRESIRLCRSELENDDGDDAWTDTTAEVMEEEDPVSEEDMFGFWALRQTDTKFDASTSEFTAEEIDELWEKAADPSSVSRAKKPGSLWYDYAEEGPAWEGKSGWTGYSGPSLVDDEEAEDPVLRYFDERNPPSKRIGAVFQRASESKKKSEIEKYAEELLPELANGRQFGLFPAGVGDRIPLETTLFTFDEQYAKMQRLNASQLFGNKTWALFGMHGAFNPICEKHLEAVKEWSNYLFKNKIRVGIVTTDDIPTLQVFFFVLKPFITLA